MKRIRRTRAEEELDRLEAEDLIRWYSGPGPNPKDDNVPWETGECKACGAEEYLDDIVGGKCRECRREM